ncbi:heterokaryon incompatibility protein-domain-containing protein [Sordaria brevicollis]|uniref:Heterokaryon incompatibility protein-domain-containing protein n=1 Tax=Sordaria brevicollis TaxID=83679 RepID=A0AAE0P376_SORBR|nr:heterokaryon incompatibility protein-domain-containing protein [Sordaria brevicollis]
MIPWHRKSCGRPDVCLVDGMPFCMSCDSLAPLDDLSSSQVPSNPSVLYHDKTKGLSLHWPSSVDYETHCYDSDGCDISSQIAETLGIKPLGEETNGQPTLSSDREPRKEAINPPSQNPRDETLLGSDSIRILHLSSGNKSDPLHGRLEVCQLKYFPEYEALSYTWGTASGNTKRSRKLYLGHEWSILPITVNCEAALRALRLPNSDRRIWVDAICINQENDDERTHQVQLMPIIYATASQVVIYIGNDKRHVDIGWTYRIKKQQPTITRSQWEKNWEKMDSRLKRHYFFRSWIIQEIAAARKAWVTDGSSWQPWPIVDAHAEGQASRTFLPWIKDFEKRKYRLPGHLVKLVMDSWSSQASDPRDKIFALLGVITGAAVDGLIADYSLSVEQVYTGLAAFALTRHGEVNILRYASGYTKSRNLPSWVPDWRLLSRDWGIMLRNEHVEMHCISTQDECIQYPWQLRRWGEDKWVLNKEGILSDDSALPQATVHGHTGTLCVQGIRLTNLSKKFKRHHFSTHAFFWGDFFSVTAPHNSDFEDSIYFLRGFDTPVVLRPARKMTGDGLLREDLFTFVGLCSVSPGKLIVLKDSDRGTSELGMELPEELSQISQWTVLHGSVGFLKGLRTENTQALHLKLAELCSVSRMEYSAWQVVFFQGLKERVNSIWDDVLHRHKKDAFALVPKRGVLSDLEEAFARQSNFWSEILGQLMTASITSRQEIRDKFRQQQQRLHTLAQDMRLLSVQRKATEVKNAPTAEISEELDLLAKDLVEYRQKLWSRQQDEGDRYCPRWYDFAGVSSYWYHMRYIHAHQAANYLEQALVYMDAAPTETSSAGASVLKANIAAATEYRRATRIASMEIKLTAKSLALPMCESDPEETMNDWQKIFII